MEAKRQQRWVARGWEAEHLVQMRKALLDGPTVGSRTNKTAPENIR